MKITTRQDAETFVFNSGVRDWEWGGNANANGFANWVFRNCNEIDPQNYNEEIARYLSSVGENPAEYSL